MRKRIRKSRFQQLHLIITLIAALIATGICVYTHAGLYTMAVWVSSTIVIFYVLGQAVRMYLSHVLKTDEPIAEEILEGRVISSDNTDANIEYANAYTEFNESGQ